MDLNAESEYARQRKYMIATHIAGRGIHTSRLLSALEMVPRHRFVPEEERDRAYADGPLSIGLGQTISQPYIVALMTDLLMLDGDECVLEVGTGCGYQAAILSRMAREVHTIEIIPELAQRAEQIIKDLGYSNITVHTGDGSLGWADSAPYDGILVAAAAPEAPKALLEQLKDHGRLVIPVGGKGLQEIQIWERNGSKFNSKPGIPVSFVPLRGKYGWK
jgi:protein-L-isoaspartate(D-aspartate) O-methyltransferase